MEENKKNKETDTYIEYIGHKWKILKVFHDYLGAPWVMLGRKREDGIYSAIGVPLEKVFKNERNENPS